MTTYCQDYGDAPDCQGEADPKHTMDFSDVEPGAYIYWCSVCGHRAHAMREALDSAFKRRPEFAADLAREVSKAEKERKTQ